MERVTGIGGIFFQSQNPTPLLEWYRDHLGIQTTHGYTDFKWRDHENPNQVGQTVWYVFPHEQAEKQSAGKAFMINYRVANLDRMLEQLKQKGVSIEKVEDYPYGRFAWIIDPEGNRIELWEPKSE